MNRLEFTYEDDEPEEYEIDVLNTQSEPQQGERPFDLSSLTRGAKNVATQGAAGFAEGLGGTLGSLLQMAGLQNSDLSDAERARYEREFNASPIELAAMGGEDDVLPSYSRLPTGEDITGILQGGGVGAPTGFLGKTARRAGQFAGGGATFGAPAAAASIAAGTVGQGLEEAGAPKWAQTAGELITFLKTGNPSRPVTARSPEVSKRLKEARRLGATEEDVTLLKNALEENGLLRKTATETPKAAKTFKNSLANTEKNVENIISEALPGYAEGGIKGIEKASGELFDALAENASAVKITDAQPLIGAIKNSVQNLSRTLSLDPRTKEAVTFLNEAVDGLKNVKQGIPADFFTNWYKRLNAIGQWVNPKEKEVILSKVKGSIKDTLKKQGPAGEKLATELEEANKSWQRYLAADDVTQLVKKASTEEGLNWGKLAKSLENPDNLKVLEKGLGTTSAKNLKTLADNGQDVQKLWKDVVGGKGKENFANTKVKTLLYSMITLNPVAVGSALSALGISGVGQRGATLLLTNPKYQNLTIKAVQALKEKSPVALNKIGEEMRKAFEKEKFDYED